MNETIRRMTLGDVDAVHAIETAVFPTPWSHDSFVYEMTQNACARYLVVLRNDEIIGFAGAHIIFDEGHVTNLAIREEWRSQGIGRALFAALMQYIANLGVRYATLEVRASNTRAQNLYASMGFQRVGVRKRYYENNGEDAWIMACDRMPEPDPDFAEPETQFIEA